MPELTWTRTEQERPIAGRLIDWITPKGDEVRGKFLGGAVWMPEGSDCYVYYTPIFWRYVNA